MAKEEAAGPPAYRPSVRVHELDDQSVFGVPY